MQQNPDGFEARQDALDYIAERKVKIEVETEEANPLQQLLTKPV